MKKEVLDINQYRKKSYQKSKQTEVIEDDSVKASWGPVTSFIGTILIFIMPQFIAAALFASTGLIDVDSFDSLNSEQIFMLYGTTQIIVICFLLIFMSTIKAKAAELGVSRRNLEKVWYAVPAFFVYFVITTMVLTVVGLILGDAVLSQEQDLGFEAGQGNQEVIMAFIALVILAPIGEELLFRGFLFKGLKTRLDYRVAIFLSAALFGLAHGQINVGFDTFVLGVVLAWLLHKTDNVMVPIVLHAIKNLLAFLLIFIFQVG